MYTIVRLTPVLGDTFKTWFENINSVDHPWSYPNDPASEIRYH